MEEGLSLEEVHNLVEEPNLELDQWEWDQEAFHMVQLRQVGLFLVLNNQL